MNSIPYPSDGWKLEALQQSVRDKVDPDPKQCGCHGTGWILSDFDTWHQCPAHHKGQRHPEDYQEGDYGMKYAGIGSRSTPQDWLKVMENLAYHLSKRGWLLRSGGAPGADKAFEAGCDKAAGLKEIFIPWKGFEGRTAGIIKGDDVKARDVAKQSHPAWDKLSQGVQRLMARNSCQVLGSDCKDPVDFVICWCPEDHNGVPQGGTSQAIRIANRYGIPVFNLWREGEYERLIKHVKNMLKEEGQ